MGPFVWLLYIVVAIFMWLATEELLVWDYKAREWGYLCACLLVGIVFFDMLYTIGVKCV